MITHQHCAEPATVGINLFEALASRTGWVYLALMDATSTSIDESTAWAAGSVRFGMPCVALRSHRAHAG
jgi:hypothetical protein